MALERFLASGDHVRLLAAATGTIGAPQAFWARDQTVGRGQLAAETVQ
jgi:hypothetical protein